MKNSVTIRCGKWEAEILPEIGANPIRLTYDGADVLRPLPDLDVLKINPFLWGSPILIPANRTDGGRFVFEGKEYRLPLNEAALNNNLHGMMYTLTFPTEKTAENEAVSCYENKGEAYPFPFRLTVTATLTEDAFTRRFAITNTGTGAMPFTFALHTTFVEAFVRVPLGLAHRRNERHIPLYYGELTADEQALCDGLDPHGKRYSGYYTMAGHTAEIGAFDWCASDNFDHWILYNNDGEQGYFCIEPQAGRSNGLNDGGFHRLAPGETEVFTTSLKRSRV